jgi:hypothetical protein
MRILTLLLILLASSCAVALRDADGYRLSAATHEADALEDAAALLSVARTSTRCHELAAIALTRRARARWRHDMELYVAGLGDDPGPRPPIPGVETVCGGGSP